MCLETSGNQGKVKWGYRIRMGVVEHLVFWSKAEGTLQDFKEQSDWDPVDILQRARPEARRPGSEQGHRLWEDWLSRSGNPYGSVCSHVALQSLSTVWNWVLLALTQHLLSLCLGPLGAQTKLWLALLQQKRPTRDEKHVSCGSAINVFSNLSPELR